MCTHTGNDVRSLCTTVCKWTYLGHADASGKTIGWDEGYFRAIGLGDLFHLVIGQVLIQTGVYVTARSIVEDDVFLAPGVITTNDNSMARHASGEPLRGPVFRRACRVGGGVVVVPGVEIGEEAFVAAGAVVTRDVAPRQVVMGAPARPVREVPDEDLIERWR